MILKDYLIECITNEQNIVEELLKIDNKIQYRNLSYDELLKMVYDVKIFESIDINFTYHAITDGEINSVLKVLLSVPNLKSIYVNRCSLGINKYLVERVNSYYKDKNIVLNIDNDYNSYKNSEDRIVVCAFDEMASAIIDDLKVNHCIVIREKE